MTSPAHRRVDHEHHRTTARAGQGGRTRRRRILLAAGAGERLHPQHFQPRERRLREHSHAKQEEIIYVIEGRGVARIDGVEQPLEKGSAVFVGMNRKHHFLNPNEEPMTFVWVMTPGGLDRYFAEIGRPRRPGEAAAPPFPRPANVAEIEARTVFGWADQSYNQKS